MRKIFPLLLVLLLIACDSYVKETTEYKKLEKQNNKLEKQNNELNTKIQSLSKTINRLLNTPDKQFLNAKKLLSEGKMKLALNGFSKISKNFKGSEYEKKSKIEIEKIKKYFKEEKRKANLKKALGFKILKPKSVIKTDELTLKFSSIQFKKGFTFDSYGSRYFYMGAERGSKYLTARVSITSKVKDPKLPPILAYKLEDGILRNLTGRGMDYRFRRWKDYGSYLGNSADYGNDFSHTKTIQFSLGSEILESEYKGFPIYIVLYKKNSIVREYERFENPPTSYSPESYDFKYELTVDDFDKENDYILIKII